MEIPMKALATAFCALNVGMLFSSAVYGQAATEQPGFQIEIRATGEKGPTYAVTNLSGKRVSACVLEISSSSSSQRAGKSRTVWDALLQGQPPIEPGATFSQYLPHVVGGPLPDKVEVIAGVWADGGTFGQTVWVNNILKTRAKRASEYEDAAAILQRGLDQNWTSNQYLQAFRDKPDSGPVYTVRTALAVNQQTAHTPQVFTHTMQFLLQSFRQQSGLLRKSKPTINPATPK
jgi:hypothetical protein